MLVEMPTVTQAKKVSDATGWVHLRSIKYPERFSTRLEVIDSLELHRDQLEAVSVLFKCFERNPDGSVRQVPSGWTITGASFEVEWPENRSVVRSHFGGRRYSYNWALGQVKADLDAKKADPEHDSVDWNLPALRKEWNRAKEEVAPWWGANSKEAYSSGIADLVTALSNWSASKAGKRKGRKVGFPKFRSRHSDRGRVRFTTGAMRFEADRRTITLPVIGALRLKENTRKLQRPLSQGRAKLLSLTLSERWGRLFVAANYVVRTPSTRPPAKPDVRCGVDLGLRTLATIADSEGNITEIANPAPLRETLAERRRVGKQLSRRIPGSVGHKQAKAKLACLDRRAVHIRRETWHQLTTRLVSTYGSSVIEDLDVAAMKKSMGRRAFRRSVSDAAIGMFRPQLTYKSQRHGIELVVVGRWWPSSQIHHGCGCRLSAPTKLAKKLICAVTGEAVDRDINAALNLRDWPEEHASCGSVGATAPVDTRACRVLTGTDPGSDVGTSGAGGVAVRPALQGGRAAVMPEPNRRPKGRRRGTPQGVSPS